MFFSIQASNPRVVSDVKAVEDELGGAVEDVFEFETEDAYMNWNGVSIALSYKYDISWMIDDIIDMLVAIDSSGTGNHDVN